MEVLYPAIVYRATELFLLLFYLLVLPCKHNSMPSIKPTYEVSTILSSVSMLSSIITEWNSLIQALTLSQVLTTQICVLIAYRALD